MRQKKKKKALILNLQLQVGVAIFDMICEHDTKLAGYVLDLMGL